MRIAVVGAGGVGGGFGAALAKAGADVTFIARRAHLAAMKKEGLQLDGKRSSRAEEFLAVCLKAGFEATLSEQITTELWMKFILLAANASITAATRQPIGKLRDDPDLRRIFVAAWQEAIDVGRASGVALPPDAIERIGDFTAHAPSAMT